MTTLIEKISSVRYGHVADFHGHGPAYKIIGPETAALILEVVHAHYSDVFDLLKETPLPPNAITWEHGVELLNRLQAAAMKAAK